MERRNIIKVVVGVVVLLLAATLLPELRRSKNGEYGRLLKHEMPVSQPVMRRIEVVTEAPVNVPATQSESLVDVTPVTVTPANVAPVQPTVTIAGGPEGIVIRRPHDDRPVRHLTGGFSKQ